MKIRPQLWLLAGGAAVALGACATWGLRHGPGVTFHDVYVEIHPGTNISWQDHNALATVLKKYDSSLYKIRRTENGKVRTYGSLQDVLIESRLLAEANNAGGTANSSLQIGTRAHPDHTIQANHNNHPEHNNNPSHNKNPSNNDHPSHNKNPSGTLHQLHPSQIGSTICEELVGKVTPILKKYSHD
jgi:hypothetical protein